MTKVRTYESAQRELVGWVFSRLSVNRSRDDDLKQMFLLGWEAAFELKLKHEESAHDAMSLLLKSEEADDSQRAWLLETFSNELIACESEFEKTLGDDADDGDEEIDSDNSIASFKQRMRDKFSYADDTDTTDKKDVA